MHKPESVLENEMCNILRDFEIQTNHLIPGRRLNRVIIKKQQIAVDVRVKIKESEKRDYYLNYVRELRKLWNVKVAVISELLLDFFERSLKVWKRGLEELKIGGQIETKIKKTVSSWQRKEAEDTLQKQLPMPTTPMS